MKRKARHIMHVCFLVLAWVLSACTGAAQTEDQPTYYFEGDDVVFVFDVRNYAKALLGKMLCVSTLLIWVSTRWR